MSLQPGSSPKDGENALGGESTSRGKSKKVRGQRDMKVRVKLPPIESYEKEVEFRLDGPGRVVVRLERLMGSDRVRLTDPKFMSTLLERLEGEEHIAWVKRTRDRKKEERNRSRQLAIEGLMEPGDDMSDLLHHPVFRVNRVLKRLAIFDSQMTIGQDIHLPPIVACEPFEDDESGAIFKTFPGHHSYNNPTNDDELPTSVASMKASSRLDENVYAESEHVSEISIKPSYSKKVISTHSMKSAFTVGSRVESSKYMEFEGEGDGETFEEEEGQEQNVTGRKTASKLLASSSKLITSSSKQSQQTMTKGESLAALRKAYNVKSTEDLSRWELFRSHLVDLIFKDDKMGSNKLYPTAEDILGVYDRENVTVDEFMPKLNKMLN